MQKKILLVLRYAFFLILGLVLAWISIHSISPSDWTGIKVALSHARYFLLIPIVVLYLLSHWSRAIRWKIMIGPLGYKPVTLNVFFAVMIGYLVNLALPRLGEIFRCSILGRHEKIPIDQLLGTIIVERAFDVLCLVIVFGMAYFLQAKEISDYALAQTQNGQHSSHHLLIWVLLGLVVVAVVLFFLYRRHKAHRVVVWVRGVVMGIWAGIVQIRFMKRKGWFIFHTVLIWTLYFICTRLGLYALKELDSLGITEALSVLCVGSVAMILTPGGLGAYPLMVQHTLTFYHIPFGIALAAGLLLWIVPTLLIIIGGVVSFVGLASPGKSSKDEELPAFPS
jgi:glycosyltransferase 2 family protein